MAVRKLSVELAETVLFCSSSVVDLDDLCRRPGILRQ
jgi:hypothetical protein